MIGKETPRSQYSVCGRSFTFDKDCSGYLRTDVELIDFGNTSKEGFVYRYCSTPCNTILGDTYAMMKSDVAPIPKNLRKEFPMIR